MKPRSSSRPTGGEPKREPWVLPDRLLGFVGAAMMVAAAFLLIFGGPGDAAPDPNTTPPPNLVLLSPFDGDTATVPLRITFESGAPLARMPGGWGVGGYHVHAEIDGREVMPGPNDIEGVGGGQYVWTVAGVTAGPIRLRLFWSDIAHRPVGMETAPQVHIEVK